MANLTAKPLSRYGLPVYPTKLEVLATPRLLEKHQPAGWLSNRELAAAAGVLLAVNTAGCADRPAATLPPDSALDPKLAAAAIVAPLFEHGKGKGSVQSPLASRAMLGCIAVAAPVYLSEDEALQVITDELSQHGLAPSHQGLVLDTVIIDGHRMERCVEWVSTEETSSFVQVSGPLAADVYDPKHRIAVEFVSREDFLPLGGDDAGKWSADYKEVVLSVGREVRRQGRGLYFGAFYDPVEYYRFPDVDYTGIADLRSDEGVAEFARRWSEAHQAAGEKARIESKRLLRQQVKDFVDWLKAQGVI